MIIYSGSICSPHNRNGGWAFVILHDNQIVECGGLQPDTTSNVMELKSAIEALKYARYQWDCKDEQISLCTDSEYVTLGMNEWIKKWKLEGWKSECGGRRGKEKLISNRDLWEDLDERRHGIRVEFKLIKRHANHELNVRCIEIARQCIRKREAHFEQRKCIVVPPVLLPQELINAMLST